MGCCEEWFTVLAAVQSSLEGLAGMCGCSVVAS